MNISEIPEEFDPEKDEEKQREEEKMERNPELYMYDITRKKIEEMLRAGGTIFEACGPALEVFSNPVSLRDLERSVGKEFADKFEIGAKRAVKDMLDEFAPAIESELGMVDLIVKTLAETSTKAGLPPHETVKLVYSLLEKHRDKISAEEYQKVRERAQNTLASLFGNIVLESPTNENKSGASEASGKIMIDASRLHNPEYMGWLFADARVRNISDEKIMESVREEIEKMPSGDNKDTARRNFLLGIGMNFVGSLLDDFLK